MTAWNECASAIVDGMIRLAFGPLECEVNYNYNDPKVLRLVAVSGLGKP